MAHRPWGVKAEPLRFLGRLAVVREGWTHRHSFFRLLKHVDFLFFFCGWSMSYYGFGGLSIQRWKLQLFHRWIWLIYCMLISYDLIVKEILGLFTIYLLFARLSVKADVIQHHLCSAMAEYRQPFGQGSLTVT